MELVKLLIEQLGVSHDQARGGAGLLFKLAKHKLDTDDYSKIARQVPDVDSLAESAPGLGVMGSMIKGFASRIVGDDARLGNLAGLAGGFSKLELDFGMIYKFIPVILSFVQAKGGDGLKGLMVKALG